MIVKNNLLSRVTGDERSVSLYVLLGTLTAHNGDTNPKSNDQGWVAIATHPSAYLKQESKSTQQSSLWRVDVHQSLTKFDGLTVFDQDFHHLTTQFSL